MRARHFTYAHHHFHEITVAREPYAVFDYVTNPNHWHEWFLASRPIRVDLDAQQPGESFELSTHFKLLPLLPLHQVQQLHCRVSKSDRPYLWEVEVESAVLKAITSYTLSRSDGGTIIKRQFCYTFKGNYRLLEPVLFRRRFTAQANLTLQRLKQQLELAHG